MKKTLHWLVESNGDLSATVKTLKEAFELIDGDYSDFIDPDQDDLEYRITAKMMTDKQYQKLPDAY